MARYWEGYENDSTTNRAECDTGLDTNVVWGVGLIERPSPKAKKKLTHDHEMGLTLIHHPLAWDGLDTNLSTAVSHCSFAHQSMGKSTVAATEYDNLSAFLVLWLC